MKKSLLVVGLFCFMAFSLLAEDGPIKEQRLKDVEVFYRVKNIHWLIVQPIWDFGKI